MLLVALPFFKGTVAPPEFVAAATASSFGGGSISASKPTGTIEGDLMIAFVSTVDSLGTLNSPPSGWTVETVGGSAQRAYLLTKVAGPSEPSSYTFGWSRSGYSRATILAYRGGMGAIDVLGTISLDGTADGITALTAGTLLAFFSVANSGSNGVSTPPSGLTQRSLVTGGSSTRPNHAAYDLTPSPAGATGDYSIVWSSADPKRSVLIQIK